MLDHGAPGYRRGHRKKVGIKIRSALFALLFLVSSFSMLPEAFAVYGDEHDIEVSNLELPLYVAPSVDVQITAIIRNIGVNNEGGLRINLLVNGVVNKTKQKDFLQSDDQYIENFTWNSPVEGLFKISIEVESIENETDTSNNLVESHIVVTSGVKEGKVGLISSGTELSPVSWILDDMIIPYDLYTNNFDYYYILNLSLLLQYEIIVYSLSTGIFEEEYEILKAYVDLGGHLLITGYGCLDVYSPLVDLIGTSIWGPGEFTTDFAVMNTVHPMMVGLYAQNKIGNIFTPIASDYNSAKANTSAGAVTVAQYSSIGQEDMIIWRQIPSGGTMTYWNDNGYIDWVSSEPLQNMFKNYIDYHIYGQQDHDIMLNELDCPVFSLPGSTNEINVTLWNRALQMESNVEVKLTIEAPMYYYEESQTFDLIFLESKPVSFTWQAPASDDLYSVKIDATPVSGETVTVNNHVEAEILVRTSPNTGKVALISDQVQLAPVSFILDEMGIEYDILNDNHPEGQGFTGASVYTSDVALMFQYQTVVMFNNFRYISNTERDVLTAYSRSGGNLLVTGYLGMNGKNYDSNMGDVLGIESEGRLYVGDTLIVNNFSHPIMNGPYGVFPYNYSIGGLSPFVMGAQALEGTITVADLGGKVYDKITSLEQGGNAVFWNGDGASDWTKYPDARAMLKNYIDYSMFIPSENWDVWVHLLKVSYRALPGETLTVNATVFNRGLQPLNNLRVDLMVNGEIITGDIVPYLETGESQEMSFQWTNEGEGIYYVEVVAESLPGEDNTENNRIGKSVDVYDPVGYILVDLGHDTNLRDHNRYLYDLIFKRYWINYTYSTLTSIELSGHDMLMIVAPEENYAQSEIDAIRDFVSIGNGLFVIGGDKQVVEVLTSYCGISWYGTNTYNWGTTTNIYSHPITTNVEILSHNIPYGSLSLCKNAQPLIYDGENETIQGAVCQYYGGKIVALMGEDWLCDLSIEINDSKIFGRNIALWLTTKDLAYIEHDLVVSGINSPDFAMPGETIVINTTIENFGLMDEFGIVVNLTVNSTEILIKEVARIIPYLPSGIEKISSTDDVEIIEGAAVLAANSSSISGNEINLMGSAILETSPLDDMIYPLSNIRDGYIGDNQAVFFANETFGPGEFTFSYSAPKIVSKVRFYQDDEYVAFSYRVLADTDNDGIFNKVLIEITDGSGTGGTWIEHEFPQIELYSLKFIALDGMGTGFLGKRAYPGMHEFEIYGYDIEFMEYGELITNIIHPSAISSWSTVVIDKIEVDVNHRILVSILNGSDNQVIPGFTKLSGTTIDISGINPAIYSSLRLLVEFIGDGSNTPLLSKLNVTWFDGPLTCWWFEDFEGKRDNKIEISFIWTPPLEDYYTITIEIEQVSDEVIISNNVITKMIRVFRPKGFVLVDEGHSDYHSGYERYYEDIFKMGYWINYTSGEITSSLLANHSMFITVNPMKGYDDNPPSMDPEVGNITTFVNNGGGLLVVGNYDLDTCNLLTSFSKIKWSDKSPERGGTTTHIMPHFITYDIDELTYSGIWALRSLTIFGGARAVVYDNSASQMTIQSAVSTYGAGRIVALVSYEWFKDSYYHRTDNKQFALNIFSWLMQNETEHDLSIANFKAEDYLRTGESTEIIATLWNLGSNSESSITVSLIINGKFIENKSIAFIAPGESLPIAPFIWTPTEDGIYSIYVVAIPTPQETYVANNFKNKEMKVFTPLGYILADKGHGNDVTVSDFYDYLMSQNFWVNYSTDLINLGILSGYDAFLTLSPTIEFLDVKSKEVTAIQTFVYNGGGLLLITDDANIGNPLTSYAGITFADAFNFEYGATSNIDPHPTTEGIDTIFPSQATLTIQVRTAAQGVVYDSSHSVTWGVASKYGTGKIMALAGAGWFDDYTLDYNDNKEFGRKIVQWLCSPQIGMDASLSNIMIRRYLEPLVDYPVQVTFHNWYLDKIPINVSMWADGIQTQNQTVNITYGTSRILNFTWKAPETAGPEHLNIRFSVEFPGGIPLVDDFTTNNDISAEIVVRPVLARILFDQSHYSDRVEKYSELIDRLEYLGYEVNTTKSQTSMFDLFASGDPNEPITSLDVGNYDALIISQPLLNFNQQIIMNIQDYVSFGMGLMVIGDDAFDVCQSLTEFAGINWSYGGAPGDTTNIYSHGITENVSAIDLQCPMARLEPHGNAFSIIRDDEGDTMLAISTQPGRVAAWVDEGSFYNDGIYEEDNMQLATNIVKWLTSPGVIQLKAPTGLVAYSIKDGIKLIWEPNKEITLIGYEIRRNSTPGGNYLDWPVIATIGPQTNYFDNASLDSEATYCYVIRAFDWNTPPIYSDFSNEANSTVLDYEPPAKPTGLWIEPLPDGNALMLHWTLNTEFDLAGYLIFRSLDNVTFKLLGNTSNDFYLDDNQGLGLVDDLTYYYYIKAHDEIPNNSSASNVVKGVPKDIVAPPIPTGLKVTKIMQPGTLRLDWNPSPAPDIDGYRIYYSETSGPPYTLVEESWTLNYYEISGLESEKVYYFRVEAFDEVPNYSGLSTEAWGITIDSTPPAPPVLLPVIIIPSGNVLNISWLPNMESDFEYYSLYCSADGDAFSWVADITGGTEYFLHTGLQDGIIYRYYLTASDEIPNPSSPSNIVIGVPKDSVAPQTPTGLHITLEENLTLNISWDSNIESDLDQYWLYYSSNNLSWSVPIKVYAPKHWYKYHDSLEGYTYYFKVAAADEVPNLSPNSTVVNITIYDTLAPAAPEGFAIGPKTGDKLILYWNTVLINVDGSPCNDLDHYTLYFSLDGINFIWLDNISAQNISYTHSSLITNQTYYYIIVAADEVPNISPNSTMINGTPKVSNDNIPPAKIQNLTVTVIPTGNTLLLQWNASTEPDFSYYHIMWGTTQGGPYGGLLMERKIFGDITHTTEIVTGLEDGVTYYFIICAVDNVTNQGPWSDEAYGTPEDTTAPAPPTGLTVEYRKTANTLHLSWDWHKETDVVGYRILRSNTSGGPYTLVITIYGRWNNTYDDPGLKNDTYYYVIVAFDEVPHESTYSNEAFGIVPDNLAPAAPTNLNIEVIPTGNTLNISWDPVTHNTDGSVCTDLAYYELYRSIDNIIFVSIAIILAGMEYYLDNNPPLVDDTTYYYYLVAFDNAPDPNPSAHSVTIIGVPLDTVAPAVPTGLDATPQQPNRIVLTWDENTIDDDIEGYTIWRSITPGGPYEWVKDVSHPQTSYIHKGLEEGTYYYVLTSYDEVPNNSSVSLEVMVVLFDLNPPAVVDNFTVKIVPTGNELNLTWDPVIKNLDGTDCNDLVEYRIDRKTEEGDYIRIANVSAGTEFYNDNNLENGVTYYYRIQAVDDANNPSLPSFANGIPEDLFPPSPPSFVLVVAPPEGRALVVTWKPSPDKDVVAYNIYRSTNTETWDKIGNKDASWTSFTDLSVQNGKLYYYRVTAVDDDGKESVPSSGSGAIPIDRKAPNPPDWIIVESIKEGNALKIGWEPLLGDIEGYYLYRATEQNGLYNRLTMNPITGTEFEDTGLVDGRTYYYKVTAVDDVPNESPPSEIGSGTPMDETAPNAPTGLFATALPEGNKIDLTWNPNTESDLEGYSIYKGDKPFQLSWETDVDVGITSYTDADLTDGTTYYYQILAFDEVPNLSGFSSLTSAMPMDTIPPSLPTGLKVDVVLTGNRLQLSWDANSESDLVNYSMYRSVDGVNFDWIANISSGSESYLDTDLTDGIKYYYKILALDEASNPSEFSDVVSGTPKDNTAPLRPEGLTVISTGESGSLMLLWIANTEDDAEGYWIYRSTDNIYYEHINEVVESKTTSYVDYQLISEMIYFYRITAFDEVPNESPESDTVSYVSHTLPQTPEGLTVTPIPEGRSLNISWDKISGSDVAFYKLYRSIDDVNYDLIATLPADTEFYIDTNLENGMTYYYEITSSTKARVYIDFQPTNYWYYIESSESPSKGGVPYDTMPPGIPTGLKARSAENGILLTWDPLDDGGTVLYNIYRYTTQGSTAHLIAAGVQGTSWLDTPSSRGQLYYYSVTAVDESEQESQYSNQASAIWDVLVSDEEFGGRPLVEWNFFFIIFLIVLIFIGFVFIWMRKRDLREEEMYEVIREIVKEDRTHEGPLSKAGIEDTPGTLPSTVPETVTEKEPTPSLSETIADKISELEKKLKDVELAARLKSLEAIRGIGEAKTSANIAQETKKKIEGKKKFIALKVDAYIRYGMFPSSMRGRLNELMTGFTSPQLIQFEGIVKTKAGVSVEEAALAVGEGDKIEESEESLAELEERQKEAETEAKTKSKNSLNAISEAKESAKEAENIRAELSELKDMVNSKVDTGIQLGMFTPESKEELTNLLMGFTPEQLEQFGKVTKAGPGIRITPKEPADGFDEDALPPPENEEVIETEKEKASKEGKGKESTVDDHKKSQSQNEKEPKKGEKGTSYS